MINIEIRRNGDVIESVLADGHALYNQGNDIVCAGVSALMFTLLASMNHLDNVDARCEVGDGYMKLSVISGWSKEAGYVFRTITDGLRLISIYYSKNVLLNIIDTSENEDRGTSESKTVEYKNSEIKNEDLDYSLICLPFSSVAGGAENCPIHG